MSRSTSITRKRDKIAAHLKEKESLWPRALIFLKPSYGVKGKKRGLRPKWGEVRLKRSRNHSLDQCCSDKKIPILNNIESLRSFCLRRRAIGEPKNRPVRKAGCREPDGRTVSGERNNT